MIQYTLAFSELNFKYGDSRALKRSHEDLAEVVKRLQWTCQRGTNIVNVPYIVLKRPSMTSS